jgi:hypothetical protein
MCVTIHVEDMLKPMCVTIHIPPILKPTYLTTTRSSHVEANNWTMTLASHAETKVLTTAHARLQLQLINDMPILLLLLLISYLHLVSELFCSCLVLRCIKEITSRKGQRSALPQQKKTNFFKPDRHKKVILSF